MKFQIIDGSEPYRVLDLTNNGECFFSDKVEAYKHMAILHQLGRNYRLEVLAHTKEI